MPKREIIPYAAYGALLDPAMLVAVLGEEPLEDHGEVQLRDVELVIQTLDQVPDRHIDEDTPSVKDLLQ